jgi:hypothetical protein
LFAIENNGEQLPIPMKNNTLTVIINEPLLPKVTKLGIVSTNFPTTRVAFCSVPKLALTVSSTFPNPVLITGVVFLAIESNMPRKVYGVTITLITQNDKTNHNVMIPNLRK